MKKRKVNMRIALTGPDGQLGQALTAQLTAHTIIPLRRPAFDLAHDDAIAQIVATSADLVIHTAAATNVDGCARDPVHAYQINGLGTKYVALACRQLDAPLVYISTNEVFAGTNEQPYLEYDPPRPINPYGYSKWVGEQAVRDVLTRFYIVRVAWLFGGERNFIRTVLRLARQNPDTGLRMVDNEIGSPTYTADVAQAVARLIATNCYGVYHLVNQGECSRHAFASEILRQTGHTRVPITPIKQHEFQRASTPPLYTTLANHAAAALGITLRPWQEAVAAYLATLPVAERSLETVP
jgi:dTDP-4-dehydrorhamnose reductase